jgi:hypothetical protein
LVILQRGQNILPSIFDRSREVSLGSLGLFE